MIGWLLFGLWAHREDTRRAAKRETDRLLEYDRKRRIEDANELVRRCDAGVVICDKWLVRLRAWDADVERRRLAAGLPPRPPLNP